MSKRSRGPAWRLKRRRRHVRTRNSIAWHKRHAIVLMPDGTCLVYRLWDSEALHNQFDSIRLVPMLEQMVQSKLALAPASSPSPGDSSLHDTDVAVNR